MPIVSTKKLFRDAMRHRYAIGAFNCNTMEVVQAVVAAAHRAGAPVILAISKGAREYAGTEYLVNIIKTASEKFPKVPIAIHQDHGPDIETCTSAIRAGFTSVMIDGSALPYKENIRVTKKVVQYAHRRGIVVEAELGQLIGEQFDAGEGGAVSTGAYTDPARAQEFVEKTGCDSLAVSIGTSHGVHKFSHEPHLDIPRLAAIHAAVPGVPLVLHGASGVLEHEVNEANKFGAALTNAHGVPDTMIREAIRHGVVKINVDTDIRLAMTAAIRRTFAEAPDVFDPRVYLGAARQEIEKVVQQKIELFGSGR